MLTNDQKCFSIIFGMFSSVHWADPELIQSKIPVFTSKHNKQDSIMINLRYSIKNIFKLFPVLFFNF